MKGFRQFKEGQFIVEFALVLPFFLLIVVGGMVDFGFTFNNLLSLQEVANKASQYGAKLAALPGYQQLPFTNAVDASASALIASYCVKIIPSNWSASSFRPTVRIQDVQNGVSGNYRIVVVSAEFDSPVYTAFWATLVKGINGSDKNALTIYAWASYQIPRSGFFQ
ncbi:MAG: pilus assembly protein [Candidatus Riflebacteria bacterium]|nr:pilus assembly protein [Candidatus Riflebacteria bacterium]